MTDQGKFDFVSIHPIDGLRYVPDFLDRETETTLLEFIDQQSWRDDLARRVQHYGFVYNYRARQIHPEMYLGPLPTPFSSLAERLAIEAGFDRPPDQVIVNEYLPGQGIAPHTDCIPCFGEIIASVSLLSACEMEFLQASAKRREALFFEPRSLLTLSGPARYKWQHAIRARKSDLIDGIRHQRSRRISLTFRTVIL